VYSYFELAHTEIRNYCNVNAKRHYN